MREFLTANITRTALLVVLLSALPAMGIIIATGSERYEAEIAESQARSARHVRIVADYQEQLVHVVESLTRILARLNTVRDREVEGMSRLFRSVKETSPDYGNILLLDSEGDVVASSREGGGIRQNFANYPFFKRTLRRNEFSVGLVARSQHNGDPVLYFALPAPNPKDGKPGVICVSINLSRYERVLSGLQAQAGSALFLVDGSGVVVLAHPAETGESLRVEKRSGMLGGEAWRGIQNSEAYSGKLVVTEDSGATNHVTFRKLFLPAMDQPYFYVISITPEEAMLSFASRRLERDVMLFCGAVFLSMLVAWGLCYAAFLQPWGVLLRAVARIQGGDLATRVPTHGLGGEIGLLSREFNAMAESLDKHDRELVDAREEAEASRVAKSEFLANMSHEIRTSMNAILGMAYLVMKTELTPQQKGYVSKLLTAANSLLRIINDILDFSKMEAGKLSMETIGFSLRRIISTMRTESASRLGERKLGFQSQIAHQVPDHLIGDPFRLSQALMALVHDAVTRSERGDVVLTCSVLELGAAQVTLQFTVHDAGVGLTPLQLAEMHEIFEHDGDSLPASLDKSRLSLAVSNRLFRLMEGRVTVESVFGEGVVFTAWARFGYTKDEISRQYKLFENERALIIDASEFSRQDLVEVLVRFGFSVECVATVDEAYEKLQSGEQQEAPFVVTFIDWRVFPEADGKADTLVAGQGLATPPAFILTTSVGRTEMPVSMQDLQVDAFLPKPVNESIVFDTLMNVLGSRKDENAPMASQTGLIGLRVLLAEDNSVNQQIAQELLESEHVQVTIANNGEEAVSLLTAMGPGAFDVVLMDLQMPVLDGIGATRAIRMKNEFHPLRLPIIAMTAHSDAREIASCFAAGMNDHTSKPITVDKLFGTLLRWLPLSPQYAQSVRDAAVVLRDIMSRNEPEGYALMANALGPLEPHMHEGRMEAIRTVLASRNEDAVRAMLAALDGLAADADRVAADKARAGRKTGPAPEGGDA